MMPDCENCQGQVLPDATFCEACGHKLGTPSTKKTADSGETKPGSLRSELAFLSGSIDQAKVRLDQWKQKGDQSKRAAEREAEQKKSEVEEAKKDRKKRSPFRAVIQFLSGLVALAAFVYLLIKLPRNTSPAMIMHLWNSMQEEFGFDQD
ncbi:zinc ribbon domain-containing protein [bacterium]|nr:zinc ribbon domain-containing protein [bacterium]